MDRAGRLPIRLPSGWRGVARARAEDIGPWQTFLEKLVGEESRVPGCVVLKFAEDRRLLRAEHPLGDGRVACRFIVERGLVSKIGARSSAARRDFARWVDLARSGVATAAPLAFVERTSPRRESWLVTQFIDDAQDLARLVLTKLPRLSDGEGAPFKRRCSAATAAWLAAAANAGWRHRDFKASNILICGADGESPSALVVDLEGLRRRRFWNGPPGGREIVRLLASLIGRPRLNLRDAARLLLDLEKAGCPAPSKSVYEILDNASDYVRRALRRKGEKLDGFGGS